MFEGLIPSLLITFREALEAALIVAIMVTYLKKVGKGELARYAYLGSLAAVVISLVLGVGIQMVYGGMNKVTAELFEGVASLTAVVVLTYMIFWMTKHSKSIRGELEEKLDIAVSRGELYSIASLAFVAVFREGLETVLFLTTTFVQDAAGTILGVIAGTAIVLVLAVLLMKGTYQLDIKKFFGYTSIILIVFSAGLAGYGVHELIEAGENMGYDFGVMGQKPYDLNPPVNPDGTYPMLHEKGGVGSILKALVGYDGNPEWLRIIVYLGYWAIIGTYVFRAYYKPRDF
jgi:high-affinity iron transporter